MLKKRTRSHHRDQHMTHLTADAISESYSQSDVPCQKNKINPVFNVPGVFVCFNPTGPESDSERSPTTPLDFRVFSKFGSPFRSPRSSNEGTQNNWDVGKVGLSIVHSLDVDMNQPKKVLRSSDSNKNEMKQSEKVFPSSDSKNILFGPQMRIKMQNFQCRIDSFEAPKSLPKNISTFHHPLSKQFNLQKGNSDVLFGIGEAPSGEELFGNIRSCSLDSGRSSSQFANSMTGFGSKDGINSKVSHSQFVRGCSKLGNSSGAESSAIPAPLSSDSASDIELSEDYTCVRTHGPNAKVTHIFGDCILECHENESIDFCKDAKEKSATPKVGFCSEKVLTSYPFCDFLSFCYSCKKKLDGEDIYIYRGEKAFCSWNCRSEEILIDEEEMDRTNNDSENSINPNSQDDVFEPGLFIAT